MVKDIITIDEAFMRVRELRNFAVKKEQDLGCGAKVELSAIDVQSICCILLAAKNDQA